MKNLRSVYFVITLFFIQSLYAELNDLNDSYKLDEVLVTSTKTKIPQSEIGSSITVITSEDLSQKGAQTVIDVLQNTPGITIIQNGSFGGNSSLFLRGTKPGHTLVLIDGIEMNDPMISDRSFDFANLLTDNIERIEILRGAQSTLYGSDAMGGVINIISKKGQGEPKLVLSFEGGSHQTHKEELGLSGAIDKFSYSSFISNFESDGISKAKGGEEDGYENTTLSTRFGYQIFEETSLDFLFRYMDVDYDYDDGANQDDPNKTGKNKQTIGKIAFDQVINSLWEHKISYFYSQTEREYKDLPDSMDKDDNEHNWFDGQSQKIEWQHDIFPVAWLNTTTGFEYEEEEGKSGGIMPWDVFVKKKIDNFGFYIQNQISFRDKLFITLGFRLDDHDIWGTESTYKVSTSYTLPSTETRFKCNFGTGFKSPTLYQLYSQSYGNLDLNPDEGETFDIGFEQKMLNNQCTISLAYFYNDFKNMVEWSYDTWRYQNSDNIKINGVEFELNYALTENIDLGTNYTYTKTEDKDTGLELPRRPENQAGVSINYSFLQKGNVNLSATYIGSRWDDYSNIKRMKSYTKLDIASYYDFTEKSRVYGRIDNLLDEEYEQVHGYASTKASFYLGMKKTF